MAKYELRLYKRGATNSIDSKPFEADSDEHAIEKVTSNRVQFDKFSNALLPGVSAFDYAVLYDASGKKIRQLDERDFKG